MIVHGTLSEARTERYRRRGQGRPAPLSRAANATLADLAGDYFRARSGVLAPSTVRTREDDFRRHIHPELGHLTLGELTRERVERWLSDLVARAPSRRMVVQTTATLRVILQVAVEWERIPQNPVAGLRLPTRETQHEQATERVLTEEQLDVLLRRGACGLRQETLLRAAGEAGLRRGEVVGLRWPDVNVAERRIEVRRSVFQERGIAGDTGGRARKIETPTKGRRTRRVAISSLFVARLAAWFEESVLEGGADASGYVWSGEGGEPMGEHSPSQVLKRALVRVALTDPQHRPLVSFHGLRHTAASIMLAHGVPIIVVSRQLGHANPQITATTYAHLLSDAQLDLAAAAFEGIGTDQGMTQGMSPDAALG